MALHLRPLARADFPLLGTWLAAPHVHAWWREASEAAAVEAHYGPAVDGLDPTEHFVVEYDGRGIGMLQRCRIDDHPDYRGALEPAGTPFPAATLDYLIGDPDLVGQGLGPQLIAASAAEVWTRYPDVAAVVIAVQQDNRRSWRALEKAGFHRAWSGQVKTDDPSDDGPSYVYVLRRPEGRSPDVES